jgi:hypothetical protein
VNIEKINPKVINPKTHGIIDYAIAGAIMSAPYLFNFRKKDRTATWISRFAGLGVLGLSLTTNYPLGVFKKVPFPTHGIIEASSAAFLATAPLIFGYRTRRASLFHTIAGLSTLGVVALTNYKGRTTATAEQKDKNKEKAVA